MYLTNSFIEFETTTSSNGACGQRPHTPANVGNISTTQHVERLPCHNISPYFASVQTTVNLRDGKVKVYK